MLLGAGRAAVDSTIDPAVGVILHRKVGDAVEQGEPLCTLLVNDESALARGRRAVLDGLRDRRGRRSRLESSSIVKPARRPVHSRILRGGRQYGCASLS